MRILSWNINGIRTLPQYHPWNTLKGTAAVLEHLEADVICFQEMKTSRPALTQDIALPGTKDIASPGKWDSFFSFPTSKGGYSGVAVYTNSESAVPLKAEEGLAGILPHPTNKQPYPTDEKVSPTYPFAHQLKLLEEPPESGCIPCEFTSLEAEGRALVLDFGLFVLINTYCPNEGSEERLPFKMNYHRLMEERVRKMVEEEGREVIVVGDINICARPIDHCDGHLTSNATMFHEHPAREFLNNWLGPTGPLTDVVRRFWPDRKGMYTCWNTKISARDSNYGTRIDYVLVTKGLIPWIKHGDILPDLKGSDHCPVYVDLHDEITLPSGEKQLLRDVMHMGKVRRDPPRIAAKYWDEFSGKQTRLSTFFGKKGEAAPSRSSSTQTPNNVAAKPIASPPSLPSTQSTEDADSDIEIIEAPPKSTNAAASSPQTTSSSVSTSTKRKEAPDSGWSKEKGPGAKPSASKKQKQHPKSGQSSLASFFAKPKPGKKVKASSSPESGRGDRDSASAPSVEVDLDADYQLALKLSQEDAVPSASLSQPGSKGSGKGGAGGWSQILAPIKPPCCLIHGESTKEYTVGKPGPNKGKTFFLCSRPVGPGYDKGRSERLREEVDHMYRCDFFKWSSEVRRSSTKDS